jgi:flagellar protein FlaG
MVSELQTLSSKGLSPVPSAQASTLAASDAAKPKVSAPKSVDIQFDEGQHRKDMQEALTMLNEQMSADKQGLGFSFDEVAQRTVVTVRNTISGEVVRQIPTEDFLKVSRKIEEFKGILYNKTV